MVGLKRLAVGAMVAVAGLVAASNVALWWLARGLVVSDPDELAATLGRPTASSLAEPPSAGGTIVAIVPGARVYPNGEPSRSLGDRIDAAVELFDRNLVNHVLVSGDNREGHYDEPTVMRRQVHLGGVDLADISVDYAGFDTWDTCARAHRIFGVDEAVFVTQQRYASRAAALCRAAGIDTTVFAVPNPALPRGTRLKSVVREPLAAVKAVFEVLTTPDPYFLGPFEGLAGSEQPANPDPVLGEGGESSTGG